MRARLLRRNTPTAWGRRSRRPSALFFEAGRAHRTELGRGLSVTLRVPRELEDDMRVLLRRPSPAFVLAGLALAVALGGTSYAAVSLPANSVGTAQLKNDAVTSLKVKNGSLLK